MADIVGSAVIAETVSSIVSSLSRKDEQKVDISETIERLEIAHIKMEVALDMSNKWQISSMPLLRWRCKLKRAAQECDNTLRQCKQRAIEEEDIRQQASQSSFPNQIVHATKSFISSFIHFGKDESTDFSGSTQRFERFADGATEFLTLVEFGGTPRQYMFFNSLIGHVLTGKAMRYQVLEGSRFSYFGIRPMRFAERGVEALIGLLSIDFREPLKGLNLSFMIRLSDSTDIIGVMIKCMQSVSPHFTFAADLANRELIRLPTQDFVIVPHYSPYVQSEYWDNIHNTMTQWCRPNPLCCNEHDLTPCSSTSNTTTSFSSTLLSNIFQEEVIMVLLQCHIVQPDQHINRRNSGASVELGGESSLNPPYVHPLKLGLLFLPHDSPKDIKPAVESYALEVVDEKEPEIIHWNACHKDLDEKLVPKAADYLYQNAESKMYQICLKTRHGTAHLCVEKTSTEMQRPRRSKTRGAHERRVHIGDKRSEQWKKLAGDLLKLWVVRASHKLEGSIRSWAAIESVP